MKYVKSCLLFLDYFLQFLFTVTGERHDREDEHDNRANEESTDTLIIEEVGKLKAKLDDEIIIFFVVSVWYKMRYSITQTPPSFSFYHFNNTKDNKV